MSRPIRATRPAGAPSRLDQQLAETPWERGDVLVLTGRLLLGGVGILAGWIGCSDTVSWNRQQVWVAVGIAGVVIALTGVASWLLAGLRAVRAEQGEVLTVVQARLGVTREEPLAVLSTDDDEVAVVTGAGMTFFHRPGCVLVRGKEIHAATRREADRLEPCWVCNP